MNTATEVMNRLRDRSVNLWVENDQLLYEAPEGALTADDFEAIRAHKPSIMERLRAEERERVSWSIERADRRGPLPLSFAQQRLWFIDKLENAGSAYHLHSSVRLGGSLDASILEAALRTIVDRHEVLRTVFTSVDGTPMQRVVDAPSVTLPAADVSSLPAAERQAAVQRLSAEQAQAPFDLTVGPLIRNLLVRVTDSEHVLLTTMHHIVSDGWSLGVFVRELATVYAAYRDRRANPLLPLRIQYADYAQWQRRWSAADVLQGQRQYWKEQLTGAPALLALPTDRPRRPVQSYRGASLELTFDAELSRGLKTLARKHQATMFMVLMAGWSALMSRLAGQDDIVVGTATANRDRGDVMGLIGCFINALAVRVRVPEGTTVASLIAHVKDVTLGAYAHQQLPFEQVIDAVQPRRSLSHSPVFQVLFTFQNTPQSDAPPDATLSFRPTSEFIAGGVNSARYDLTLSLEEAGDRIVGGLNYATDIFDERTIRRWVEYFRSVLAAMVADESCSLDVLPLIDPHGVDAVDTARASYPIELLVHQRFERQAAETPLAAAVTCEGLSLTYAELNRRANRLARYLRECGVGPDRLVAICLDRSIEMVVAVLAVAKAGGAYVPLDVAYPVDRLTRMLDDAAPLVVITEDQFEHVVSSSGARVISMSHDAHAIDRCADGDLDPREVGVTSTHMAYVIYTSGSTGTPKGVMVEHRNLARLFAATADEFQFDERDVWTLFHSIAFDFSAWELWGALLHGGRLVVVPYFTARAPRAFYRLLLDEGVTVLNQTPTAFTQLIAAQASETEDERPHRLRLVIFGGETLKLDALKPWLVRQSADSPRLVNMYGITETTVHVTWHVLTREAIESEQSSVIGRPIPDLSIHLLDRRRRPVPVGVPAEMYIGGAGVARGYLHQPALTAERFIDDPFSTEAGAHLYRTGDVARRRADGVLEYLGRNDSQVKIRGFRIELGEVEAQLRSFPGVADAAVVAREDTPGERRLVAYMTHHGSVLDVDALRRHLEGRLPDYMVPSALVPLDVLPLTPNGKLDRQALPAPDLLAQRRDQYVAPRNALEQTLCGIWAEVLDLERVGVTDDFFAVGGDSILSIQVFDKARRLDLAITIEDLFRHRTIEQLAQSLAETSGSSARAPSSAPFALLSPEERLRWEGDPDIEDAYPLSLLQEGIRFHSDMYRDSTLYHDILSHAFEGPFRREAFEEAVRALVQRHPALRTGLSTNASDLAIQFVRRSVDVSLSVEDISHLIAAEQERFIQHWIDQEKHRTFVLSQPPLARWYVHILGPDRWEYTLSLHHIIVDGWSGATLQTELFQHYLSALANEPVTLTPPKALYRDYVALEQRTMQSDESREFWRSMLADVSVLALPMLPEARDRREDVDVVRLEGELAPALGARLAALARGLGVSLKALLLAAHVKVLSLMSGQEDVVTGVVANGRLEEEDGDKVIGLHLNALPFRTTVDDGTWRELVVDVQAREQAMLPHRRYPLHAIQQTIGIAPLVNTLFNFTHFHVYQRVINNGMLKLLSTRIWERTNYSVLVNVSQALNSDRVLLAFTFDEAVLTRRQGERMMGHYLNVLEAMAADVDARHRDASLLSDAERDELDRWNATTTGEETDRRLVHEMVDEQARQTPTLVAIDDGEHEITYEELAGRSDELARFLRAAGVGPDVVVATYLNRGAALGIAWLGILKAGGAFLSLDPSYPAERRCYMLADSAPAVILTQERLQADVSGTQAIVVALDTNWSEIEAKRDADGGGSAVDPTPEHLAYVVYTSGSTGQPKGIGMPHRALSNLIEWQQRVDASHPQRTLQFAALGFDVAIQEAFSTFASGGTLVVIDEETRRDPRALLGVLRSRRVQRLFVPFTALRSLAEVVTAADEMSLCLEDVIASGEALRVVPAVMRMFQTLPSCRLHNQYGPAETHVVSALTLTGDPVDWEERPTIGRPIANVHIHILDSHRRRVPVGTPGEIYVGGVSVARGYQNRPDLTEQRFVADPFRAGGRLYKTGDVARFRSDGTIEFLGRNDEQVKIRGLRVELGEIESQLRSHAQVRDAVVVATEEASGDMRLAAYFTLADGVTPAADDLRQFLRETLPEYMIPSAFVAVEAFPRSPNGKLDRRALPAPVFGSDATSYLAPQGSAEVMLAIIWQDLLDLERVSRDDRFLDIGGHSLVAVRVAARVNEIFGTDLAVNDVFAAPTIASLAEALAEACGGRDIIDQIATEFMALEASSTDHARGLLSM